MNKEGTAFKCETLLLKHPTEFLSRCILDIYGMGVHLTCPQLMLGQIEGI